MYNYFKIIVVAVEKLTQVYILENKRIKTPVKCELI